jgi:hypothetical protein
LDLEAICHAIDRSVSEVLLGNAAPLCQEEGQP